FAKIYTQQQPVIWCEGPHAVNGIFGFLPFVLTKGETITIEAPALKLDGIFKKDFFIVPIGNDQFKVGATYEWNELNWEPSETGLKIILQKLSEMVEVNFTIVNHEAGIRPTVKDRRPLLGEHPTQKNNFIF